MDPLRRGSLVSTLMVGLGLPLALALPPLGCAGRDGRVEASAESDAAPPVAEADPSTLDGMLERDWKRAGIAPAPLADDATYLRRVSLDLVGRIPTPEEVDAFLADPSPDKREALVERLLASEDYADYWAEVYLDLMIGQGIKARRLVEDDAREYLRTALAEDRGWDRMVREMITAEGTSAENGASAFLIAHLERGNSGIANLTGATSEKFLGVQLQCAQCHDHPYDDFTRDDFWALSAFYARTRVRADRDDGMKRPTFYVAEKRRGETRISDEGEIRERVVAPAFLGRPVELDPADDRRDLLAREVTDSELLAKAAVGRLWTHMFARGIVEPWNDLGGEGKQHPPMLELLADDFREGGYSHKQLLRTIALSSAYQRSSSGPEEGRERAEQTFARAPVRSLSAEQLFGALLDVTGLEHLERRAFRRAVQARKKQALKEFSFVFADDEMGEADAFSGNVPQALLLLNGGLTNQGTMAHPGGTLATILDEHGSTPARADALFRAVYARPATAEEQAWVADWVAGGSGDGGEKQAWEDLMFAMLYSSEFLTNH